LKVLTQTLKAVTVQKAATVNLLGTLTAEKQRRLLLMALSFQTSGPFNV
jgi:hypothetical protein